MGSPSAKDAAAAGMVHDMREWARRHGIRHYFEVGRGGIEHALGEGHLRLSFATRYDACVEGAMRIRAALPGLPKRGA